MPFTVVKKVRKVFQADIIVMLLNVSEYVDNIVGVLDILKGRNGNFLLVLP